ncbi:unnamed protein product, partial [Iphiclides podalirius]
MSTSPDYDMMAYVSLSPRGIAAPSISVQQAVEASRMLDAVKSLSFRPQRDDVDIAARSINCKMQEEQQAATRRRQRDVRNVK